MSDSTDIDFIIDDTNWWKKFCYRRPKSGWDPNFKNIYYVSNENVLLRKVGTAYHDLEAYHDLDYDEPEIIKRQNHLKMIIRIKKIFLNGKD